MNGSTINKPKMVCVDSIIHSNMFEFLWHEESNIKMGREKTVIKTTAKRTDISFLVRKITKENLNSLKFITLFNCNQIIYVINIH